MKFCWTILLLVLCLTVSARNYDVDDLQDEVSFLCGERFQGRQYGSAGDKGVAVYIGDMFRLAGLDVQVQSDGDRGLNVIGRLNGAPGARDIIISSFYDGAGHNANGELCPGADANASGIVAMLELARAFTADPIRAYNLVFVALDGHYAGLTGGRAFAEGYGGRAKFMINLDTMGSSLSPVSIVRKDYIIALGGASWANSLERANNLRSHLDITYDYYGSPTFTRLFYRVKSSHKYMLDKGVPCIMFTSGITMNTNHPSDSPQSLDYPVLARRILLIENWVRSFDKTNINY